MAIHLARAFIIILVIQTHLFGQHLIGWPDKSERYYYVWDNDSIENQLCEGISSIHKWVILDGSGKEYYCSGNVMAEGELCFLGTAIYKDPKTRENVNRKRFKRSGQWTFYYDSSKRLLKAQGEFEDGIKSGTWTLYRHDGSEQSEITFKWGQVKKHIELAPNGIQTTLIDRADSTIFILNHENLLILIALIPVLLFRMSWNVLTYNKVYKTNYIPGLQNWQKGGSDASLAATFIFWWILKDSDQKQVRDYKLMANWISVLSVIVLAVIICFISIYRE